MADIRNALHAGTALPARKNERSLIATSATSAVQLYLGLVGSFAQSILPHFLSVYISSSSLLGFSTDYRTSATRDNGLVANDYPCGIHTR